MSIDTSSRGFVSRENKKNIICCLNLQTCSKSEKYDFDVNIYDEKINLTDPNDPFDSNNAVPKLIFDNFEQFNQKLNNKYELIYSIYKIPVSS